MARRIRWTLMALALVAPLAIAACAANEEPAEVPAAESAQEQAPAAEQPAGEETAAPAQTPAEETAAPAEQAAPQEPELVGEIKVSDENFEWGETTRERANYTWTAHVTNDTTATLDIIVRFEFLDEQDQVIKTESKTVRLAPAESTTVRESGSMSWDQANRVYSFRAVTDYRVVNG